MVGWCDRGKTMIVSGVSSSGSRSLPVLLQVAADWRAEAAWFSGREREAAWKVFIDPGGTGITIVELVANLG